MDYVLEFQKDYAFFIDLRARHRAMNFDNYENDNERLFTIANKYTDINSQEGKYWWLMGMCWYLLGKAAYRKSAISCFEKYLSLVPFEEEIAATYIPAYRNLGVLPKSKAELDLANKEHFKVLHFILSNLYIKENRIEEALDHINKGIELKPDQKVLFIVPMYEACRKANNLQYFLKFYETLPDLDKEHFYHLAFRAQELINRGYVFKSRRKK